MLTASDWAPSRQGKFQVLSERGGEVVFGTKPGKGLELRSAKTHESQAGPAREEERYARSAHSFGEKKWWGKVSMITLRQSIVAIYQRIGTFQWAAVERWEST